MYRTPRIKLALRVQVALLALLLAALLPACRPKAKTPQPQAPAFSPTPPPVLPSATVTPFPATPTPPQALPSATATSLPLRGGTEGEVLSTVTEPWIPTPFPTSLEAFSLHYDPDAKLEIPPWGSVSMLFWGDAIPVTPVFETPEFVPYPTPQGLERSADWLLQLGCELDRWGWGTCPPDNPLQGFGCTVLVNPDRLTGGIVDPRVSVWRSHPDRLIGGTGGTTGTGGTSLVAICKIETEEHEAARINGLYLSGCAFKTENHYIFQVDGEYLLVSSLDELKRLFVPIDGLEQAVSYAQLVTGLDATYSFTYDPTLMYFQEILLATHVTQVGSAFEINLFNMQGCGCEPWFNTQITIRVDRDGQVTWVDAVPIYMTTGWSCAD